MHADTKLSSLYTIDTNKMRMHMRNTKHSSQEKLKIRVMKSSRTSWRSLKRHAWMQEEQKHAIDTKLKMRL